MKEKFYLQVKLDDISSVVNDIENAQDYINSLSNQINEAKDTMELSSTQLEKIKSYMFSVISILQEYW